MNKMEVLAPAHTRGGTEGAEGGGADRDKTGCGPAGPREPQACRSAGTWRHRAPAPPETEADETAEARTLGQSARVAPSRTRHLLHPRAPPSPALAWLAAGSKGNQVRDTPHPEKWDHPTLLCAHSEAGVASPLRTSCASPNRTADFQSPDPHFAGRETEAEGELSPRAQS